MKTVMQVGLKMLFIIHTLCIVLKGTQDEVPDAGRPENVYTHSLHSVKGDPR